MSNPNIPPAVREEINKATQLEEQLRALEQRIRITQTNILDIEKTLKELSDVEEEAVVYKNVGRVLIHTDKNKMIEELKEELSDLQMRKKNYERTNEKTKSTYDELRKKIMQKLPQQPQA